MKNRFLLIPKSWGIICLLNLCIASVLGIIMRYKMIYPLPWINQSHIIHSHSHFVFHGWATLVLVTSFICFLLPLNLRLKKSYSYIFWLLEISSVGMLITFIYQGYALPSILFSTLAQITFYWFSVRFIIDIRHSQLNPIIKYFSFAAIFSFIISSIGPYFLAYFSVTGMSSPLLTRGVLYFYLHFQYNGWFSFAIFTLFFQWLTAKGIMFKQTDLKKIFSLLIIGVIPGYCLSLIGYLNDTWVYVCSYFSIFSQLIAIIIFFKMVLECRVELSSKLPLIQKYLWGVAFLSLIAKSTLQAFSLNPNLAIVAFSLRPLVIGYLHLIFICMLSFFMIGYLFENNKLYFRNSSLAKIGTVSFFIFSIISEMLLFLQAYGYYFSVRIAFIPKTLFYITIFMTASLVLLLIGQRKSQFSLIN